MSIKSKITILGATGSIGDSTLAAIRKSKQFEVYALTAFSNIIKLAELCNEFQPRYAVVENAEKKAQVTAVTINPSVIDNRHSSRLKPWHFDCKATD